MNNSANYDKLCFVLPADNLSGGVRVTVRLAEELHRRGRNVRIVYAEAMGLKYRIKRWRSADGWIQTAQVRTDKHKSLHDVVFAEDECIIAVGAYVLRDINLDDLPNQVVSFCHGISEERDDLTAVWDEMEFPVIAVSEPVKDRLKELFGISAIGVVVNGVETDQYFVEPDVTRDGIGTIWATHQNKDPDNIVNTLELIRKRRPDIPLYMFGVGKDPRIDGVTYWQSPEVSVARQIYNRARVWLLCSKYEGLPGPVLESMACGASIVSTDNVGSKAIIEDGHDGTLVPMCDAEAIADAALRIYDDGETRNRFVDNAKHTVSMYTWSHAAEEFEKVVAGIGQYFGRVR